MASGTSPCCARDESGLQDPVIVPGPFARKAHRVPCTCLQRFPELGRFDFRCAFSEWIILFFLISLFFLTGSLWSPRPKRRGRCQTLGAHALKGLGVDVLIASFDDISP